jgi:hypothetical protein
MFSNIAYTSNAKRRMPIKCKQSPGMIGFKYKVMKMLEEFKELHYLKKFALEYGNFSISFGDLNTRVNCVNTPHDTR